MKCLFCTSEALPFAASGGLGDVSGSLPKALRQRLIGCRVVMPLYEGIPQHLRDSMRFVTSFSVPVSHKNEYCGVFEAKAGGVIYYLLDNEYYFKREGFYGYGDDAERFAFFSRACLEMLPHVDFQPDIIHANDWQTALIPVYFSLFYVHNDFYRDAKTVLTIHNIQYQGKYDLSVAREIAGIPQDRLSLVEFDNCTNFLKGGIETANRVTTVSPSYAHELMDPWFAHGLDPILRARSWKLSGILNGIDTVCYDPQTDPDLYENYSDDDISGKAANKRALQERLGLAQNEDIPLIGMVTRMTEHKGLDLVKYALDRLMCEQNVQFVILGAGEWDYENFFKFMQEKYRGRLTACFGFVPELSRKIYAASDIFLMPSKSEPCGLSQMIALRYGAVPVVRATGGLRDSVQDSGDGSGNGFVFGNYDAMEMLHSVYRAISGYRNKHGWNILQERAMRSDNSWGTSANEYIKLYRAMMKEG